MKKSVLSLLIFCAAGLSAQEAVWRPRPVEIIDVPTADVVDHYGYHVSFRFGKEGGLQNKTSFGVFQRLNIGFGLDGEKVIGTRDARMNTPTFQMKFRPFDGKGLLPALAIGYDGQGYIFNQTTDEYEQREKGFFLVGTSEVFFPNFLFTIGVSEDDFNDGKAANGFTGFTYGYEGIIRLLFEWDNFSDYRNRRINYGLQYFVTPVFSVDAIGRNVPEFYGSRERETERVLRLSFTGSF